jgi:hypothetical protein
MIGNEPKVVEEHVWPVLHDLAFYAAFMRYPFAFQGYKELRLINTSSNE